MQVQASTWEPYLTRKQALEARVDAPEQLQFKPVLVLHACARAILQYSALMLTVAAHSQHWQVSSVTAVDCVVG